MLPSRKLILLAGLGLVPAVLAVWSPLLFAAALLWLVACCAMLAGNFLWGVRPAEVTATRRLPRRLSLGEPEVIALDLRNFSRFSVNLEVLDSVPAGWKVDGLPAVVRLSPGEEKELTYRLTPGARGRFSMGDLFLRIEHAPGMVVRQVRIPAAAEFRVYPDLREISKYELMARRSHLTEIGIRRSRLAGRGTEFERIRDYTPDDEYRQIDWKATARRHRPMSRVYEVERSQNVLLVLDAGRMMAGRVGQLSKLDYAVNAALMLAHVALKAGDRVGVMTVSDAMDAFLPPGKGDAHFRLITELLFGVEAQLCHVDYRGALQEIATRVKRRSLVMFFTDLVDEDTSEELVTYLRLLRPTHLPVCVTLQDQQVVKASRRVAETAPQMFERTVAIDLLSERRRILESLQKLGALVLDSAPHDLTVAVVNQYMELKLRGRL